MVYIPPSESEICFYQAQGNIICGDFNARTGAQPEGTRSQGDSFITQQVPVNHLHLPAGNNLDTDQQEREGAITALQRLQSVHRRRSDKGRLFGKVHLWFNSTVDYMITDMDPLSFSASQSSPKPFYQTTPESPSSSNRTTSHTQNLTSCPTYRGHTDGPRQHRADQESSMIHSAASLSCYCSGRPSHPCLPPPAHLLILLISPSWCGYQAQTGLLH